MFLYCLFLKGKLICDCSVYKAECEQYCGFYYNKSANNIQIHPFYSSKHKNLTVNGNTEVGILYRKDVNNEHLINNNPEIKVQKNTGKKTAPIISMGNGDSDKIKTNIKNPVIEIKSNTDTNHTKYIEKGNQEIMKTLTESQVKKEPAIEIQKGAIIESEKGVDKESEDGMLKDIDDKIKNDIKEPDILILGEADKLNIKKIKSNSSVDKKSIKKQTQSTNESKNTSESMLWISFTPPSGMPIISYAKEINDTYTTYQTLQNKNSIADNITITKPDSKITIYPNHSSLDNLGIVGINPYLEKVKKLQKSINDPCILFYRLLETKKQFLKPSENNRNMDENKSKTEAIVYIGKLTNNLKDILNIFECSQMIRDKLEKNFILDGDNLNIEHNESISCGVNKGTCSIYKAFNNADTSKLLSGSMQAFLTDVIGDLRKQKHEKILPENIKITNSVIIKDPNKEKISIIAPREDKIIASINLKDQKNYKDLKNELMIDILQNLKRKTKNNSANNINIPKIIMKSDLNEKENGGNRDIIKIDEPDNRYEKIILKETETVTVFQTVTKTLKKKNFIFDFFTKNVENEKVAEIEKHKCKPNSNNDKNGKNDMNGMTTETRNVIENKTIESKKRVTENSTIKVKKTTKTITETSKTVTQTTVTITKFVKDLHANVSNDQNENIDGDRNISKKEQTIVYTLENSINNKNKISGSESSSISDLNKTVTVTMEIPINNKNAEENIKNKSPDDTVKTIYQTKTITKTVDRSTFIDNNESIRSGTTNKGVNNSDLPKQGRADNYKNLEQNRDGLDNEINVNYEQNDYGNKNPKHDSNSAKNENKSINDVNGQRGDIPTCPNKNNSSATHNQKTLPGQYDVIKKTRIHTDYIFTTTIKILSLTSTDLKVLSLTSTDFKILSLTSTDLINQTKINTVITQTFIDTVHEIKPEDLIVTSTENEMSKLSQIFTDYIIVTKVQGS